MYNYDMNDPVVKDIVAARVKLLFEKPFFGQLATRLDLIDATAWCPTAATDGVRLYYNREFIKSLTKGKLLFLIGHEVMHAVLEHIGRREGRDPQIWNMANDYIVNFILKQDNVGTMPDNGLFDPKYTDEMSSEEVYADLLKNAVKIELPLDMHLDMRGDSDDGEGEGESEGESGSGSTTVTVIGKDGPPKLTPDDIQNIRNQVRAAVISTAHQVGAGKTPAGVRRLIDALTQPKLDWRSLLDTHVRSALKNDYTFQRPSRRSWDARIVLPGMNYMDTIDIFVAIDTSGSMTEEMLRDFLSEVKGIMETFGEFTLRLVTFDTQIYDFKEFTSDNLHEILQYPMRGGGGTMFECVWEFMKRNGIEPQRLVFMTDGCPCGGWGDSNYVDTLFVIHGDAGQRIKAPHGTTCYYEGRKQKAA